MAICTEQTLAAARTRSLFCAHLVAPNAPTRSCAHTDRQTQTHTQGNEQHLISKERHVAPATVCLVVLEAIKMSPLGI